MKNLLFHRGAQLLVDPLVAGFPALALQTFSKLLSHNEQSLYQAGFSLSTARFESVSFS
jgi:hypothetical protein